MTGFPRSGSVSSFSTTGETIYTDARSMALQSAVSGGSQALEDDQTDDTEKQAEDSPAENQEDPEPVTEQPQAPAEPVLEKKPRGYQPEETQCHAFWCSDWAAVLDLPAGAGWMDMCFACCCNSCFNTGVGQAKTVR